MFAHNICINDIYLLFFKVFIYSFILFILFYFILFYFILFIYLFNFFFFFFIFFFFVDRINMTLKCEHTSALTIYFFLSLFIYLSYCY